MLLAFRIRLRVLAPYLDYARVRSTGSVHETQNGFYVEGVEIGEMGENGTEVVYRFNCYTERGGALVNTHKESAAAAQQ